MLQNNDPALSQTVLGEMVLQLLSLSIHSTVAGDQIIAIAALE